MVVRANSGGRRAPVGWSPGAGRMAVGRRSGGRRAPVRRRFLVVIHHKVYHGRWALVGWWPMRYYLMPITNETKVFNETKVNIFTAINHMIKKDRFFAGLNTEN